MESPVELILERCWSHESDQNRLTVGENSPEYSNQTMPIAEIHINHPDLVLAPTIRALPNVQIIGPVSKSSRVRLWWLQLTPPS